MAAKRVFVYKSIYERFLEALVAYTKNFKIGPRTDYDLYIRPVQNEAQYNNVRTFFDYIINKGQRPVLSGINEIGEKASSRIRLRIRVLYEKSLLAPSFL